MVAHSCFAQDPAEFFGQGSCSSRLWNADIYGINTFLTKILEGIMFKLVAVAAVTIFVVGSASAASAQGAYGTAVTLGYNHFDSGAGSDSDGGTLQAETDMVIGQFSFDLAISYGRITDGGETLSKLSTDLLPKYWFSPSVGAGVYFARDSIDLDIGDVINLDSYGVEGTYRDPRFEVSVFAGRTDLDEVSGDLDARDLGFRAQVDITPEFRVFGSGVRTNLSMGGNDLNIQSVGIGGLYDFGQGLAVFGGYRNTSIEDSDFDLDTASLGLNYGMDVSGTPVVLSGEYARFSGDALGGETVDRLSVSATILLGGATQKRIPGNAITNGILKTDRNAFSGTLTSIGF